MLRIGRISSTDVALTANIAGAAASKHMCAPEFISGAGSTRPLFSPAIAGVFLYGRDS